MILSRHFPGKGHLKPADDELRQLSVKMSVFAGSLTS